jgi:glycosyltransferase involved in cell wall biosynthesis
MKTSLISVIMSVYNSEKYLLEAIESILNQSYNNFEFIIINDGSKDNSLKILKKFQEKDSRIILINRGNKGLAYSLNEGISLAKGDYIARMDADDISFPDRFEKQIKAMEDRKLDICGGTIKEFYNNGKSRIKQYPLYDNEIKLSLISLSPFAHPAVMMKKNIFDKVKYNILEASQDYDLWAQIAINGFTMGNIEDIVLKYRIHDGQITVQKRLIQKKITYNISKNYLNNISKYELNIDKVRFQANYINFLQLLEDIVSIAKKENISDDILLHLIRYIFRSMSPMRPSLLISYLKATKKIKKDFKGEIAIIIQSLFFIDIHGYSYNLIRKILK